MSTLSPPSPATPRDGRVDVAPLRAAFEASGLTASAVALLCDWTYTRDGREHADGSRVKRALGLASMRGARNPQPLVARSIAVDVAARIADAIGADPRDVGA